MAAAAPGLRQRGRIGQRLRKRRLARTNGLCERCDDRGLVRIADRVDHIKPLAMGGLDVDENTRNLCQPCHLEVTAEQFGFVVGKGTDASGRPTFSGHAWNLNEGRAPVSKPAPNLNEGEGVVESLGPPARTPASTHRMHCDAFQSKKLG